MRALTLLLLLVKAALLDDPSRRVHLLVLAAILASAVAASPAAALPEDPGPLAFNSEVRTTSIEGSSITFDLYMPDGAPGPFPIVAVVHGFMRSRATMADWGRELAKRGYIAAVPGLPGSSPDHAKNGRIISALLDHLVAAAIQAGDPLSGKVDGTRRGALGHSAGGLACLLAASTDQQIDVVIGLDPVDASGLGSQAAPAIGAPTTFILAQPSSCNSNGNAAQVFPLLGGARLSVRVKQGTHCDAESPTDVLCGVLCGAADAQRHARFRRYAFATLDYVLACQDSMASWLGGADAGADQQVEAIISQSFPPVVADCAASVDAGVADGILDALDALDGAGVADGSRAADGSGIADDAGGGNTSAGAGAEGCCELHPGASARNSEIAGPPLPLTLLLGLWLLILFLKRVG